MIDRDRILQAFSAYTSRFDASDLMIANKKNHTMHVACNCEWIAKECGLTKDDIDLAWLIGILHDIGRFEQVSRTGAYTDSIIDHAEVGIRVLFHDGLIDEFIDERISEIKLAVLYHNRLDLPSGLLDREKCFCNIIRDADKIDNFRGFNENDFVSFHERSLYSVQHSTISDTVLECFKNHSTIPHCLIKTDADFFLLPFALLFGIVYECSYELIEIQGNYRKMLQFQFESKGNRDKFDLIKQSIISYMTLHPYTLR